MMKIFSLLFGNWRMILIGSAVAGAVVTGAYLFGYFEGKQVAVTKSMKSAIIIREKQNEVITHRPDTHTVLIERLRSGKF